MSLMLCLLSVNAVCADSPDNVLDVSYSDNVTLDSPLDDGALAADGVEKSFSQLQAEIANDTTGTITLNDNYGYDDAEDAGLVNGIVISKDLTINGNGCKVDAKNLARIFNISGQATVVLTNITFVNGFSNSSSGAIYSSGDVILTVDNCIFNNNHGTYGGAIWAEGTSTITNSQFTDNTASKGAGAVNLYGGSGSLIDNCIFDNNNASKDGGAVYVSGDSCTVSNSKFTNNVAGDDGGALYWEGDKGTIKNITCENNKGISDNDSSSKGGTICFTGDDATISDSSFSDSFATYNGGALFVTGNNVNITGCDFENCKSNVSANSTEKDFPFGGAIYLIGNYTMVDDCTFEKCSAVNGGVIYVEGHDVVVSNSDFTNNNATKDGGVLNVVGDDCELVNSTFTNNIAGDDGGVANWEGDRGVIHNITCENNKGISDGNSSSKGGSICLTGDDATISDSSFSDSFATYNGGALFVTGNNVNITGCDFEDCKSDVTAQATTKDAPDGGAIYIIGNYTMVDDCTFEKCSAVNGGVIYVQGHDALISNSDFTNNNATKDGGVLNVVGDDCELANSTFTDNFAGDDGGVANWEGVRGVIYNITCENNKGISAGGSNSKGGSICLTGDNATISESTFTDSSVTYNGGALFVTGDNVNITDCEFENCKSNDAVAATSKDAPDGGAIYIIGEDTFVDNCTFDDCSARYGGSIYVKGSNAVINGSEFEDTSAKIDGGAVYVDGKNTKVNSSSFLKSNALNGNGGAVYINNVGTNISNSNFTDCHAKTAGAVYINGKNTTIDHCNLENNTANSAGAIRVHGNDTMISYSNFTHNLAKTGDGGALDIGGENASVYYSSFQDNDAKSNGGAINWLGGHGSDSIIGSNFTNNTCHNTNNGGGAIFWTAGDVISSGGLIKDCTFINNTAAAKHGGAVNWFRTKDSTITNCTFIGNRASSDGGALYTGDKSGGSVNLTISNSKFYNNTANKHGGAIANQMSHAYIYNNTFDGNKANSSGGTILIKEASGSHSIIDHCNITNSYVHSPINTNYGEGGGAIRIGHYGKGGDENITISNCIIINTTTGATYGGAISVQTNDCKLENITIINSTSKNHQGGAIQWSGSNGKINNVNITNSSTHTNGTRTAGNANGGAIYWTGTNGNLNNVTIVNAYTNSTNSKTAHGGAIYVSSSNTYLNNISVNDSYASGVNDNAYGGAIYLDGNKKFYITNATLINNTAVKGGAVYGAGSQTRLSDSLLKNNSADEGGAVFLQGGGHILDNVDIINNTATNGGGVYFNKTTSGDNMIKNSNISYNKAFKGSGIYGENSQFKLENDILLDNQAHSNKFTDKFISYDEGTGNYTIGATFLGYDNLYNGIWIDSGSIKSVKNLSYWDVGGVNIANTVPALSDQESWQNITVERYDENGNLISSKTVLVKTDKNGQFKVDVGPGINSKDSFKIIHYEDNYYTYIYDTISNVTILKVKADDIYIGQNSSIEINLTDGTGKPLTGNVTFKLNATGFPEWTVEVINGTAHIYNITGLDLGTYNASALFAPNSTYFGSSGWDTFKVLPIVVLDINKTVVPDHVKVGESVVFTINVTNIGPCNATGVNITDIVPEQFGLTDVTKVTIVSADGKREIDATVSGNNVTVNIEKLNVGEYAFFNITATALANGTWNNTATTVCNENETEYNSTVNVTVDPVVKFSIVKTSNATIDANATVGDLVNFTITVTNLGPSNATDVTVSDVLNRGFEYVDSEGSYDNATRKVTWKFNKLNYGENVTVWVTARASTNGFLPNTAHVNSTENTTGVSNKTTAIIYPAVNITLIKKSNVTIEDNASVGALVNFTISIINFGPSNATNVNISDVVPDAFEYVDSRGDYDNITRKVTWNIGDFNFGDSTSVWLLVRAKTNGFLPNVAHVNSTENKTGCENKTTVVIYPAVNITLVKKSNLTENAKVGDLVNFTISIVNYGPSNSTDVNISDVLDDAFEYVDSRGDYDNATRKITWNIGDLDYGASTSVWVVVKVLNNGTFENAASVNSTENTTGTSNKTNVTADPVNNFTLIKKSNLTENAKVGDLVNFTISVTNVGPSNATNVNVSDVLGDAFEYVDSKGSYDNATRKITWNIGKLDNGSSISVWVVVKVLTNGTFENVASVNSSENTTGTSNKTNVTVDPVVNLTLVKKSNLTENAKVYDLVNFTITVTNHGPSNATKVNVSDILGPEFEYVDSEGSYDNASRKVTWTIDKINNGTSASVWVVVKVLTNGTFVNVATVSSSENTTNVSNKTSVTVDPVVNFTIVKTSNATVLDNASVGDIINFTITITNVGPSNATNVTITDELLKVFEYVDSEGTYNDTTRKVTWKIEKLNYGENATVWVTVKAKTNGFYRNIAHVNSTENPNGTYNGTTAVIYPAVNMTLIKKSNVTLKSNSSVYDLINFTITITNYGPSNATDVNITDVLDDAFEYVDSDGDYDEGTRVITWNIGDLDYGNTTSVWVLVKALTNGTFENAASVNSTENTTGTSNKTNVTVDPVVNLTLIKKSNLTQNAKVGDLVNFTIIVTNLGPSNATNVTISDVLDSAFGFDESDGNYDYATREITWNINKIDNGTSVSVWVVVKVLTNGTFENVAFVNCSENTTGTSNKTNVTVDPVVNLTLVKSSNLTENAKVGDLVNFTITVTNLGPSNATGVNVSDVLDVAFEYVGSEGSYNKATRNVTWNIAKLSNGSSVSVWVVVKVLTNGTFENVATVSSSENTTNVSNGTNVTVDPVVNLTLVKSSNLTENAKVGDLVNFTITVTNLGPSNATGVNVSDVLDAAFAFESSNGVRDNNKVTWNINRINNGTSVSVWVVVKVLTNGTFENVAFANSNENDTDVSNGTNVTVDPVVNLTLVKSSNLTENAKVGDLVNFTITVTNLGPSNATDVNISDVLDAAFEYVGSEGSYNKATRNVTWNIAKLSNGSSVSVWVVVKVLTNGTFENVATVNCSENTTGTSNKTNVTVDPVVNLTLVKSSNLTENAKVGDLVNFTITVTNLGPSNATDVNISDVLDSAFGYESSNGVESNGKVTWTINKINNGTSVSVWVVVKVLTNGTFENAAAVNCSENTTGTSNKTSITADPVVNLTLIKSSNLTENANIYDLVNFTITVTNLGPSNATNVNVTDVLDSAFEYVDSEGSYDNATCKITWNIAKLSNGSSVSVWVVVKVLTNGTFVNVASVNSSENTTGTSNKTNVTVNPAKSLVNGTDKVVVYGEPITIEVDSVNATGIIYQIIDEDGNVVANGTVGPHGPIADLGTLPVGNYTVNLTTVVDEHHTVATNQSKLTVLPANSTVSGKDVVVDYGEPITVDVTSENATGIIYEIIDEDGNVVANGTIKPGEDITGLDLAAGNYTVNLTTVTDGNHIPSTNQSRITVNKAPSKADVNDTTIDHGDVAEIPVKIENATGVTYEIIDKDGNVVAKGNTTDDVISVPGLKPGEYTIRVTTIVDENHTSTTCEAKITVRPIVDLELTKVVDKTNIKEGDKVTYTLIVKNNGPSDATGVKVTDKAITQHKFVSASSDAYDSRTGIWSIGDLASGSSITLTVTVIIEKAGTYANTAFASSNENDTNMSNNNASSKDVVVSKSDKNETHNETTPQSVEVPVMHETGNPILVLLLVLMALILPQLRRFKK